MNIIITGRKCTPRHSFKDHAEKKLAKVAKFFDDSAQAKVTATVEKSIQTVEVTVASRGMIFRAEESAQNMNEALDNCVDSIIRQIRRNKTRLEKKLRAGNLDDIIAETVAALEKEEQHKVRGFFSSKSYAVTEEEQYDVVRTKTVALKPESVEEAILQMNLLGHLFYMFRNAASDNVAVVYHRDDGGYGLIEPEEKE